MSRKKTIKVNIGKIAIGGNAPISIQSMCTTQTKNSKATIEQILELEKAGCDIIRVAIPDKESVKALKEIKENISIPLVADIHFDHKLAINSAPFVDKLRINPGTIGTKNNLKEVINVAKQYKIPIRIGINLASLDKKIQEKYGKNAQAMVNSALETIKFFEQNDFHDIVVSLKASDINKTIEAYQIFSQKSDYPLHLGVTESGTLMPGIIKSSIAMSTLLKQGIGDTIRVSLTAHPIEEVNAAKYLLQSLQLRKGLEIISCPTCARTEIDLIKFTTDVQEATKHIRKPIKIAVMGCAVNGPGEVQDADIGVTAANGIGLIFKKGKITRKVEQDQIVNALLEEIDALDKK